MVNQSAAKALLQSVGRSEIRDIGTDLADLTLDAITNDAVLEAIPLVQWLAKARRAVSSVRDELFFRKVCRFLAPMASVSEEEREDFSRRMAEDPNTADTSIRPPLITPRPNCRGRGAVDPSANSAFEDPVGREIAPSIARRAVPLRRLRAKKAHLAATVRSPIPAFAY